MNISEKELEDFIFEDLTKNSGAALEFRGFQTRHNYLLQKGHVCMSKWLRQVELGPYGRADIVGYYRHNVFIYVEIMELKIVPIEIADFEQIFRYKKAIQDYFGERFDIYFSLHLVGPGFKSGHYIHNDLPVNVVTFEYGLTGIEFELHTGNWCRPDAKDFNYLKSLHNAEALHGYR